MGAFVHFTIPEDLQKVASGIRSLPLDQGVNCLIVEAWVCNQCKPVPNQLFRALVKSAYPQTGQPKFSKRVDQHGAMGKSPSFECLTSFVDLQHLSSEAERVVSLLRIAALSPDELNLFKKLATQPEACKLFLSGYDRHSPTYLCVKALAVPAGDSVNQSGFFRETTRAISGPEIQGASTRLYFPHPWVIRLSKLVLHHEDFDRDQDLFRLPADETLASPTPHLHGTACYYLSPKASACIEKAIAPKGERFFGRGDITAAEEIRKRFLAAIVAGSAETLPELESMVRKPKA